MLNRLQSIRRLLTAPTPHNIRIARLELDNLKPSLDELCSGLTHHRDEPVVAFTALEGLRSELSAIMTLSKNASDYFTGLAQSRISKYGAYERSGTLRTVYGSSRTIMQL